MLRVNCGRLSAMDRDPTAHRFTPSGYYIGSRKQKDRNRKRETSAGKETPAIPVSDSLKK
jgi:hypothetical protein